MKLLKLIAEIALYAGLLAAAWAIIHGFTLPIQDYIKPLQASAIPVKALPVMAFVAFLFWGLLIVTGKWIDYLNARERREKA